MLKSNCLPAGNGSCFGVSGDDFVVVHQAFLVNESLNNYRVVKVRNASGGLARVKETGAGSHAKGFVPRQ